MSDLRFVLHRPGSTPLDLSAHIDNNARWSTQAVGGFGSCTLTLPGSPSVWKPQIPYLSMLRVTEGVVLVWEGEVEDIGISYLEGALSTRVQAFGLRRLLDRTKLRRIWSRRDIPWREVPSAKGANGAAVTLVKRSDVYDVSLGAFDLADLTKTGVLIRGIVNQVTGNPADRYNGALYLAPTGMSIVRLMGHLKTDTLHVGEVHSSTDGSTYTLIHELTTSGGANFDLALAANTREVRLGLSSTLTDQTLVDGNKVEWTNLRVLGTSLTEDAAGGFYGGTLLRDLIALVPGLAVGIIDAGSDFTITQLERSTRDSAQSIVDEIASYYAREWGVWEGGRFDWKAVNLDEPHWTCKLADFTEADLDGSVDGIARTVYVLYTDAASGTDEEQSATATDQANPFVKQSKTKDVLVQPGFPMTSTSAVQLATKLAREQGGYVPAAGRIVVSADQLLGRPSGSALPAHAIRAGENILVSDLPKTDLFRRGRDGETMFHIVSVETNMAENQVELQVEAQVRRTDVLLARLALATRTVTG